jgi:di/tricarboxylate transporter
VLKTYQNSTTLIMSKTKDFTAKWYPIIIAFICLVYSVGLGLAGKTEEAQYSAHWPGTILLFAIAIRQRRRS